MTFEIDIALHIFSRMNNCIQKVKYEKIKLCVENRFFFNIILILKIDNNIGRDRFNLANKNKTKNNI